MPAIWELLKKHLEVIRDHYVVMIDFAVVLLPAAFLAGRKMNQRKRKKAEEEAGALKENNGKLEAEVRGLRSDLERYRTEEALEIWEKGSDREFSGRIHSEFAAQ